MLIRTLLLLVVVQILISTYYGNSGVVSAQSPTNKVTALHLVRATTGAFVANLKNNTVLYLNSTSLSVKFTVLALTTTGSGPVRFAFQTNPSYSYERNPPFLLCGGTYSACSKLIPPGNFTVTAFVANSSSTTITSPGVQPYTVSFSIVSGTEPLPPTTPVAPPAVPIKSPTVAPKAPVPAAAPVAPPVAAPVAPPVPVALPVAVPVAVPAPVISVPVLVAAPAPAAPMLPPQSSFQPILINCGGIAYTDANNRIWSADVSFTGGQVYGVANDIANTMNDELFRTIRWGQHQYNIPVPSGRYDVILHMAEIYFTAPRSRIFDVSVEGFVLNDIDVVQLSGGAYSAVNRTVAGVAVTDGMLTIEFMDNVPVFNYPCISAIEVNRNALLPMAPPVLAPIPANAPVAAPVPILVPNAPVAPNVPVTAPVTPIVPAAPVLILVPNAPVTAPIVPVRAPVVPAVPINVAPVAPTVPVNVPVAPVAAPVAPVKAPVATANAPALPVPVALPTVPPTPPFPSILINCGGNAYTDTRNRMWSEDKFYAGGQVYGVGSDIAGTLDDELFRTIRWGQHQYDIPVPSGTYDVIIHMAEIYFTTNGSRVFDMIVEGISLLDIDIVRLGGGVAYTALNRTVSTVVTDGSLTIQLRDNDPLINYPAITAIEVNRKSPPVGAPVSPPVPVAAPVALTVPLAAPVPVVAPSAPASPISVPTSPMAPVQAPAAPIAPVKPPTVPTVATPIAPVAAPVAARLPTNAPTVMPVIPPTPTFRPILINCGGNAYTDTLNRAWSADQYFTGGQVYGVGSDIAGTADDELFRNIRWGQHRYDIPLPSGMYDVVIHLAEIYFSTTGSRVFDMVVEGVSLPDIDIVLLGGGVAYTALSKTVPVVVTDGVLTILLQDNVPLLNFPSITAIEVNRRSPPVAPPVPVATPVSMPVATPVAAPVATPVATPVSLPVSMPAAKPVAVPVDPTPVKVPSAQVKAPNAPQVPVKVPLAPVAPVKPPLTPAAPAKAPIAPQVPVKAPLAPAAPVKVPLTPLAPVKTTLAPEAAPTKVPVKITLAPAAFPTKAPKSAESSTSAPALPPLIPPTTMVPPTISFSPIRINCGSTVPYKDSLGQIWTADEYYTGGVPFVDTNIDVTNTIDDALYNSERYGVSVYNIPVPTSGKYTVVLHFAEIYFASPQARVFDISVEGRLLANIDIVKLGGNQAFKAVTKTLVNIQVSDGFLTIRFLNNIPMIDFPKISAIEVLAGAVGNVPTIAPMVATPTIPTFQPILINCGGDEHIDGAGRLWHADQYFTGGLTYDTDFDITDTEEDDLYNSERYGEFVYAIPVPNGQYNVVLHLAEIYQTESGKRVFDVLVESRLVDDIDIVQIAGEGLKAITRQINSVSVADGFLTIAFNANVPMKEFPKISAIEVNQ